MRRFAAITLALSVLTACAPSGPKKLEFWTLQLKPAFTDYVEGLIAEFEKQNPGIDVEWVDLPGSAIEQKALSAVTGGTPPDVINLNPQFATKLAESGALLALDDRIPAETLDDYFPSALDATRIDGKLYGVPWYLSTTVSFYNGELLSDRPSTYQALAKKKLKGAMSFLPNFGDSNRLLELMALDGVTLLSPDKKHAAFDTPEGRESFRFWVGLFRDKTLPVEALSLDNREIVDRFQAGQSAALAAGPQFLKLIKENAPQLYPKLAVGPQFAGRSGKVGVGVMNLVVPANSDQPEDAVALATFVTNAANQLAFAKLVPILPSAKEAAKDPFFTQLPEAPTLEDRARKIAAEQLERAVLLVPPMPHHNELAKALNQALQKAALGQMEPDAALAEAAAEWDRILARP